MIKQNFEVNTVVELHSCMELSGMAGVVLGKASEHAECDFYIVMLDKPLPDRSAVVMIESCIRPLTMDELSARHEELYKTAIHHAELSGFYFHQIPEMGQLKHTVAMNYSEEYFVRLANQLYPTKYSQIL